MRHRHTNRAALLCACFSALVHLLHTCPWSQQHLIACCLRFFRARCPVYDYTLRVPAITTQPRTRHHRCSVLSHAHACHPQSFAPATTVLSKWCTWLDIKKNYAVQRRCLRYYRQQLFNCGHSCRTITDIRTLRILQVRRWELSHATAAVYQSCRHRHDPRTWS